jgi:methionine synthase I (cobalamin-dependent)
MRECPNNQSRHEFRKDRQFCAGIGATGGIRGVLVFERQLTKTGKQSLLVIGYVENRQQLRDGEQFPDFLRQIQKLELTALIDNCGEGAHQFADT